MKSHLLSSLAIACVTGLTTIPAVAQEKIINAGVVQDVGAQERINFSGKLRMLSQRIPSAACHLSEGVDPEAATKLLTSATVEFDKIVNGLEFGDPDLKIVGAETRRKTLAQIHDLRSKWEPVKIAAQSMAAGDVSEENLAIILDQNMAVLGSAKLLVSELVGQYSDPSAMLQAHSMLIDISGRQRMLTQKMSKESCMLASQHANSDTAEQLNGTMEMFEVSLMALMGGMADAGIRPPPNQEIAEGLNKVSYEWNGLKPTLETLLSGEDISIEAEADKFNRLNITMGKMNEVVQMYAEAAKMGL